MIIKQGRKSSQLATRQAASRSRSNGVPCSPADRGFPQVDSGGNSLPFYTEADCRLFVLALRRLTPREGCRLAVKMGLKDD